MPLRRSPLSVEPTTYSPDGIFHSTRRRSRSYSSWASGVVTPSGNGGTGPSLTGMAPSLRRRDLDHSVFTGACAAGVQHVHRGDAVSERRWLRTGRRLGAFDTRAEVF